MDVADDVLGRAIIEAAERAGIGVAVTLIAATGVRNIYVSDAAVELLGGSREELLGTSALARIAPEERDRVQALVEQRLRGELLSAVIETVVLRPDGTRKPIATASHRLVLDGVPASVSFFWDLSELKAAEARAIAEHQRLRSLIEASPDAVVISSGRGGPILFVNSAAVRLLGEASAQDVVGKSLAEWLPPEGTAMMRERMAALVRGEPLSPQEYPMVTRDGVRVVAEVVSTPFVFDGQPVIVGFARDVTERARLHEQLRRSQRFASLGTLAAGVAHEINNPLTTMSLSLELLDRRLCDAALDPAVRSELQALTRELREGTDRVTRIAGDLRTFSRTDPDEIGPADLVGVLHAAIRISAHALRHHARLVEELPPRLDVKGSASRLEQVFVNLLINAAQAIRAGGVANEIRVHARALDEQLALVEVIDTGPGIPSDVVEQMFDPFFTTKSSGEGMGLGLAISHNIVARLGGRIEVESELGRGTTMRVILPRARPDAARVDRPGDAPEASSARARILIIDDEPALCAMLERMLGDRHEVEVQTDSTVALAQLLGGRTYDVILCDLTMPQLGGLELYDRLVEAAPACADRFVFITGGLVSPQARARLASCRVPVLEKPFRSAAVEALVAARLTPARER